MAMYHPILLGRNWPSILKVHLYHDRKQDRQRWRWLRHPCHWVVYFCMYWNELPLLDMRLFLLFEGKSSFLRCSHIRSPDWNFSYEWCLLALFLYISLTFCILAFTCPWICFISLTLSLASKLGLDSRASGSRSFPIGIRGEATKKSILTSL